MKPDWNLRLTEAWFRLLAEAARGTRDAQDTVRELMSGTLTRDALVDRISRILPGGVPASPSDAVDDLVENFWSATGVVPRARYLELLERYDALRDRLEEAEVTIRQLRKSLDESGNDREAARVLDVLSKAVGDTLRAQTQWMRDLGNIAGRRR